MYGNTPQLYTVPPSLTPDFVVDNVVVKVWGAGGGGAKSAVHSIGGGGGFVQVCVCVCVAVCVCGWLAG